MPILFLLYFPVYGDENEKLSRKPVDYKTETFHFGLKLGAGITEDWGDKFDLILWIPAFLEVQKSLKKIKNLKLLFQAGGFLTYDPEPLKPAIQIGLKYNFSNTFYGSVLGGSMFLVNASAGQNSTISNIGWTGGLFFGMDKKRFFVDIGIQPIYREGYTTGNLDIGIFVSIGSLLKSW